VGDIDKTLIRLLMAWLTLILNQSAINVLSHF